MLKNFIKSKILHILLLLGAGVFFVSKSYNPGGSGHDPIFRQSSWGSSFDPLMLAVGVVLIAAALLIYRKWSSELRSRNN
jgi:hypothetical protein